MGTPIEPRGIGKIGTEHPNRYISGKKVSRLRKEFDSYPGKFLARNISLPGEDPKTAGLENWPEYCPRISVVQVKADFNGRYIFNETIYTSNQVIDRFAEFLKAAAACVAAEGFDETPREDRGHFRTPFTSVPVDIGGIDYGTSCALRMVKPDILNAELEKIEKSGDFLTFVWRKEYGSKGTGLKFIAFEHKKDSGHGGFRVLFKNKDLQTP